LLSSRDLAGDEEPEETFGKRFRATGSLGKLLLNLGNGLATEADALLYRTEGLSRQAVKALEGLTGVQNGAFPD
jgi:hypothetical protein